MSRPLSERVKDWRWWGEQVAHFILGAVAALPAVWGPMPITAGTCAAGLLAIVREYEQRPVGSWGDTIIDAVAVILGGFACGIIVRVVA